MSAVVPELALLDRVERRVLGAFRCVDATTRASLHLPLRLVTPPGTRIARNRSGLFVIHDWPPLDTHTQAFAEAPATPLPGSQPLSLSVSDPLGHYLSRRVRLALPRNADAAMAADPASIFVPVEVPMFPSGTASVGANWAGLRVSLRDTGSDDALGGVLLRVLSGGQVLARGLSDWRGEALVPVAGIPVTTWSAGPGDVVVTEIDATLEAYFDPASATRVARAQVLAGRSPDVLPLVDPVAIEDARAGLPQASVAISLAAGRPLHVSLGIDVP